MSQRKREDLLRKGGICISRYDYDSDYPFAVYIANLGMYKDGRLVGEWVKFPTTAENMRQTLKNIGIGKKHDRDQSYENWFVFDDVSNLEVLEGFLNSNINEMNYLASKLNGMSEDEYQKFRAAVKMGDHSGSIQELINLTDNLDCYDIYPYIHDYDDLGRRRFKEADDIQLPDDLLVYVDYDTFGRDIAFEEKGQITNLGYMLNNGSPFNEHYDGRNSSIPEEYRVMTEQDYMRLKRPEPIKFSFERDEPSPQDDSHHAADQPEKRKVKDKKLSVREWLKSAKRKNTECNYANLHVKSQKTTERGGI